MIANPATAATLAESTTPPGATLVTVNGVGFGDPVPAHPGYPPMLMARGLSIEGGFQTIRFADNPYVLVTVWLGEQMVTLTLNPSDLVVVGTTGTNQ